MRFNLELEVPSLNLCRQLKELGYPQKGGGWYWVEEKKEVYKLVFFNPDKLGYIAVYNEKAEVIKAPTVRELGEILNEFVIIISDNEANYRAELIIELVKKRYLKFNKEGGYEYKKHY